jgi:hypothetical protein
MIAASLCIRGLLAVAIVAQHAVQQLGRRETVAILFEQVQELAISGQESL